MTSDFHVISLNSNVVRGLNFSKSFLDHIKNVDLDDTWPLQGNGNQIGSQFWPGLEKGGLVGWQKRMCPPVGTYFIQMSPCLKKAVWIQVEHPTNSEPLTKFDL